MLPCGTPMVIDNIFEIFLLFTVSCIPLLRNNLVKLNAFPLTPQCLSLFNKILQLTVSNALAKSIKMPHPVLLLSYSFATVSCKYVRAWF